MASIKQSLKKVYKALSGGTDSSSKSISGIIDDISTVASSGGGGSSDIFIVNFTMSNGAQVSDKTSKEIYDAVHDGKIVVGFFAESASSRYILHCSVATGSMDTYNAEFSCPTTGGVLIIFAHSVSGDNTSWSFMQGKYRSENPS